jgi:hypothetical protein
MQKLENKYPKSPDVSLGPIDVVNQTFRGHVNRGADVNIFEVLSK